MPKIVHIDGVFDEFRVALADRLQRAGADLVRDIEGADVTVGLGGGASGDIVVVPLDSPHGAAKLVVRVHDLIVPSGGGEWGTGILSGWVEGVKRGNIEDRPNNTKARHWVHVRDVVDALTILIMAEGNLIAKGTIDVCGRRAWAEQDVIEEIGLLWQRYLNAIHHTHTLESLSDVPSPVRASDATHSNRPDLRPLHNALIDAGGEGWHPLVPMRTSLMELIALSGR
jgi:nucleoside-diphosphate-sugar epimerase